MNVLNYFNIGGGAGGGGSKKHSDGDYRRLQQQLEQSQQQLNQSNQQLEQSKEKIVELKLELGSKKHSDEDYGRLQQKLEQFKEKIVELKLELGSKKHSDEDYGRLQQKLEQSKEKIVELKLELQAAKGKNEQLQQQLDQFNQQVFELTLELQAAAERSESGQQLLQELREADQRQSDRLAALKVTSLRERNALLESKLDGGQLNLSEISSIQFLTESNQLILALCRDAGIVGNKNAMLGRQSLDADRINAEIVEIRGKMAKIEKCASLATEAGTQFSSHLRQKQPPNGEQLDQSKQRLEQFKQQFVGLKLRLKAPCSAAICAGNNSQQVKIRPWENNTKQPQKLDQSKQKQQQQLDQFKREIFQLKLELQAAKRRGEFRQQIFRDQQSQLDEVAQLRLENAQLKAENINLRLQKKLQQSEVMPQQKLPLREMNQPD